MLNTLATRDLALAIAVIATGAIGTWLLLPHRFGSIKPRRVHLAGAGLAALSVLLFAVSWTPPGPFLEGFFFYAFGVAAVFGGILTITSRNPVYSALWFASVVLSTSGLFLLAGAQFLAAGTVIVYAGAIVVTFLFVIMLAQQEGQATYDRAARSPFWATLTCYLLLFGLMYSLLVVRSEAVARAAGADSVPRSGLVATPPPPAALVPLTRARGSADRAVSEVPGMLDRAVPQKTSELAPTVPADPTAPRDKGTPPPHVAGLGGTLFTDHLIAVEAVGALLFVSLVGAVSIAVPRTPVRPASPPVVGTQVPHVPVTKVD